MVTFINGSLGVGKTTVANYLLWKTPKTVLLEGDALCAIHPFDAYDQARISTLMDIIQMMVVKYQAIGYTNFVVDTVFEKAGEIESMDRLLTPVDPDIAHYLLVGSPEFREENIRKRRRDNFLWEIERSQELQDLLVEEFGASRTVKTVEVTGLTTTQVGERLWRDRTSVSRV